MCIFEYIYFSRPDSRIFGHEGRQGPARLGRRLAEEHPAKADIVIAVPDSANTAALGYSEASGIRFEIGLIRNHYVGRTFISPHQHERDLQRAPEVQPRHGRAQGQAGRAWSRTRSSAGRRCGNSCG